eukprot:CAMPEP_0118904284 /NCGR_PEP_ID=MMETSP1166-20130328/8816_1 /TAXON_ID=1104430 /ORGANISM="Chrysoreinhardia sp, Strain CCMP3193" /LENGTH=619 /DNA_ID=CAMNT_0006843539 /DNA_START=17 /DNA_END=1876 /DNA_ORIENTATION=+
MRRLMSSLRQKLDDAEVFLVLIRHGQSRWNARNRFTGWTDVRLTTQGEREAWAAGQLLGETGIQFQKAFTSELTRAQRTTQLVLEAAEIACPTETNWRLNERHYGALTGLHKTETMQAWGAEQTMAMRRGNAAPPPMCEDHPMWRHVSRGREVDFLRGRLPRAESLPDTRERVWDYWRHHIVPCLGDLLTGDTGGKKVGGTGKKVGKDVERRKKRGVLVVSHLHTIRLLISELDGLDASELYGLEVPNAVPLVYGVDARLVDLHASLGPGESAAASLSRSEHHSLGCSNAKVAMVKGKWLGETRLTGMPVEAIRSLLLRRRGLLYELLPNLPEPIQNLFFDASFEEKANAAAAETVNRCQTLTDRMCDDGYFRRSLNLRNKDQLKALKRLFDERPWIGVVDADFADACARAVYAVSTTDPTSPPRRKYDGLRSGYHQSRDDDDDDDGERDDDDEHDDRQQVLAGWASNHLQAPPRAAAAALTFALSSNGVEDKKAVAPFVGAPVPVDQFPHFARLVGVAAYLAWLQKNGAEFLPPREYSFAKDIAKHGTLSAEEIKADLATHVDGDDFRGKDILIEHRPASTTTTTTTTKGKTTTKRRDERPLQQEPPLEQRRHQNQSF